LNKTEDGNTQTKITLTLLVHLSDTVHHTLEERINRSNFWYCQKHCCCIHRDL